MNPRREGDRARRAGPCGLAARPCAIGVVVAAVAVVVACGGRVNGGGPPYAVEGHEVDGDAGADAYPDLGPTGEAGSRPGWLDMPTGAGSSPGAIGDPSAPRPATDASANVTPDATTGSPGADAASPTGVPPSCAALGPGLSDCGPNANESCCTTLPVPGGTFYRTYANAGSGATGLADPATVSAFRLDKYAVTVGRFRRYVDWLAAGGSAPADGSGKHAHLNGGLGLVNGGTSGGHELGWDGAESAGWNGYIPTGADAGARWDDELGSGCLNYPDVTWTPTAGDDEKKPIACVNWYEAYAFCIWDGAFLPSQAEWEYAAAGGSEQRQYPWGSASPFGNYTYAINSCLYPTGMGQCTGAANIAPVGTALQGAGRWGQLDLAGDISSWTLDWESPAFANPCTDCAYLDEVAFCSGCGEGRVNGGGFYDQGGIYLTPSNRESVAPAADRDLGIRCARAPAAP